MQTLRSVEDTLGEKPKHGFSDVFRCFSAGLVSSVKCYTLIVPALAKERSLGFLKMHGIGY